MTQPITPFLPISHLSRGYLVGAFSVFPDLLVVDFQMTHNSGSGVFWGGCLIFQETHLKRFAMLGAFFYPPLSPKEMHMTNTASIVVVSLFVSGLCIVPFAMAAPAQQNKMKTCNEEATAKGLGEGKGDERKAFMKECLSAKPVKAGGTQQNKMKTCNKEAGEKSLKGDERKKFMSTCLSN
jgi:hypothetical protein